jgi:NitT/TauT family transport system permease protein
VRRLRFGPALTRARAFTTGDLVILLAIASLVYAGARLAFAVPKVIAGPAISLSPRALPWYAMLSVGRMAAAYALSLLFSLTYGYAAARHGTARAVLLPLLDVLQSVPILSFLPVVLLGFSAILPQGIAAEIAAVVLIFTSQAWNLAFGFYQSLRTVPVELREAAAIFRLPAWLRFRHLDLPFAAIGLVWNSVMSWAGGWFFLMAAEIFHVGSRDFRLPGLGSYLQTAASRGDLRAVGLGVAVLVAIVVALDQLVWRPLLAWAQRFKIETIAADPMPIPWFKETLARSFLARAVGRVFESRFLEWLDRALGRTAAPAPTGLEESDVPGRPSIGAIAAGSVLLAVAVYGGYRATGLLATLPAAAWLHLGAGLGATFLRVTISLAIALLWAVPVGALIGMSPRWALVLQPAAQILAAIPATALFPVLLLLLLRLPGGLNLAAIVLMLLGTQWYVLFNVIAGAAAIPQDLRDTTDLLGLRGIDRWRRLILPSLFPFIVTGAITASGGAWNASIVAEYVEFGGKTHSTLGVGAVISDATARGDPALLLAGTLAMVGTVVAVNRLVWRRLYRVAESRYRMD